MKKTKRKLMQYRLLCARACGAGLANPRKGEEALARAMAEREWLEDTIRSLSDPRMREVLSLRYLQGLPWEEIADRMYYSQRWVLKLHRAALIELGGVA